MGSTASRSSQARSNCKLVGASVTGPQIARRMYVEPRMLVKDCTAKSMPEADHYLRIASRTPEENH
jgi:hypothetical protein